MYFDIKLVTLFQMLGSFSPSKIARPPVAAGARGKTSDDGDDGISECDTCFFPFLSSHPKITLKLNLLKNDQTDVPVLGGIETLTVC